MSRLYILVLALSALFAAAAPVAMAAHDGTLAGRWPGDDITLNPETGEETSPDVSGHGFDLVGTTFPFLGRFDESHGFGGEGNPGMRAGPTTLHEPPNGEGLSVVAWVWFNLDPEGPAEQGPGAGRMIVAKGGRGCQEPSWALSTGGTGGLQFSVQLLGFGVDRAYRTPELPGEAIWDDGWHAVTATYDARPGTEERAIKLWVDGVMVGAEELPPDTGINYELNHPDDRELNVGFTPADTCGDSRVFPGFVDEIRIYREALDRRQIRFLHHPDAGTPPDLVFNAAPIVTERPQISGTPSPGQELSCSEATWENEQPPPTTDVYTWERAPRATRFEDDQAWAPIDGASGEGLNTYTVQEADVGSRVRCRIDRSYFDSGVMGYAVSRSVRVDVGPPFNAAPPFISGRPASFGSNGGCPEFCSVDVVTCNPGDWQNSGDFQYQWLRDGVPIPGATGQTYTPTRSRAVGSPTIINPAGDGGHMISCRVVGVNDVGSSAAIASPSVLAIDGVPTLLNGGIPANSDRPTVTITPLDATNALHRPAHCSNGLWHDDYAALKVPGYSYEYRWWRGGQLGSEIAGATDSVYLPTVDDLGRSLGCAVSTANPMGRGPSEHGHNLVLVDLPTGTIDSEVYLAGGRNETDPTNLLALSNDYRQGIRDLVIERLKSAVTKTTRVCREKFGGSVAPYKPPSENLRGFINGLGIRLPMVAAERCSILLREPEKVALNEFGATYLTGTCTPDPLAAAGRTVWCRSLNFEVAPVDPRRPPAADAELAKRLEPLTPDRILWDLNRDGRTDASCPGTAPVLRTILRKGEWNPRAVIVDKSSAQTGRYHFAEKRFRFPNDEASAKGSLRKAQVKVCATAFDPPPDPEQAPCVTAGEIGRVRLEGDLCPIDVRQINQGDFANLSGKLKQMLIAQSEERVKREGFETASSRPDPDSREPIWLDALEDAPSPGEARASQGNVANDVTAAFANNASSMTTLADGSFQPKPSQQLAEKLNAIEGFKVPKAGFALDQIYVSRGDVMKVNGVAIDPLGTSSALLIPSDIREALPSVESMTVNAGNAATYLASKAGIPLADGGTLESQLTDTATTAGKSLLRETNLDALVARLRDAADKLKLGPFKLRGTAQVKLENDGTATLEAKAVLPGLKLGPGSAGEASAAVKLRGDLDGNVTLEGIRLRPPGIVYLGGVALKNLDLAWDNGIDIRGEIVFPPPLNASIAINRFKLGPKGQFEILDIDYKSGAGTGINVGPGVFITKLGGFLNLLNDTVGGNSTISVGPSAGGGCPTAGMNADFKVHFASQWFVDAVGTVQLACLDLANLKVHADQSGLVTLDGSVDHTIGPIFVKGGIGAAFRMPNWQATVNGSGGVRDVPLIGTIDAGFKLALGNRGLAGCGTIRGRIPGVSDVIDFFGDEGDGTVELSGGAAVRFVDGRPPFTHVELLANLRFFTGCDISEYQTVVQRAVARGAQAGSATFSIPKGTGPTLLSIEGAGAAPRVRLRSPSGAVLDLVDATGPDGKAVPGGLGFLLEQEDRTVVMLGRVEAGTWTAEVTPDSVPVVRVQRANILPDPTVRARVTGKGTRRVLRYDVAPLKGQVVRLVEVANGGQKALRTVKGGGKGRVRFTVSEANGRSRRIVAEVVQDGLPRDNLTVARFQARSPRVGKARRVRVRRRGKRAVVSWRRAPFGHTYEVEVGTGTGSRYLLRTRRRRVVLRNIRKKEGVVVRVFAYSPAGRRGKPAKGRLAGNMRVGARPKKSRKRARARKRAAKRKRAGRRSGAAALGAVRGIAAVVAVRAAGRAASR